jgi:hypothetical protein
MAVLLRAIIDDTKITIEKKRAFIKKYQDQLGKGHTSPYNSKISVLYMKEIERFNDFIELATAGDIGCLVSHQYYRNWYVIEIDVNEQ